MGPLRHITKKNYSITLFPKMSEVFECCCQKFAKFVAKSLRTLLPKGSAEYSLYPLSLWLQSSLNEMKRLVTASLPSRLHHIQSHPGSIISPIQATDPVLSRLHHGAASGMGPDKPMGHDLHHLAWLCLLPPDSLRSPQKPARPYLGVCPAQDLAC